jgi:hypothetical protein
LEETVVKIKKGRKIQKQGRMNEGRITKGENKNEQRRRG